MTANPSRFESILDRECVVCGGLIPSNHPRQKTCSPECRSKMTVIRRRAYRTDAVAIVLPRQREDGSFRRCSSCSTPLSSYNRGFYCHACWSSFSPRERYRKGGDR